jgi:hypothetical protein
MGVNARQVRGDSRTEELAAKNDKEIQPEPLENEEYAATHLIHIFNVTPYQHQIEHPSVGTLMIPPCEEGQRYSKPAIILGTMPYGVPTDMTTVEIRRDSGKLFALDIVGVGPFKPRSKSLFQRGVFISSGDKLNLDDLVPYKTGRVRGKDQYINVPRWVVKGDSPETPTQKELAAAEAIFEEWDKDLIKEGNRHWDEGPTIPTARHMGHENISLLMREAARRRGQNLPWDKPIQTMTTCPGCGEMVSPLVVVHSCGAVFNWDKAIALGIKKEEDRPKKIA